MWLYRLCLGPNDGDDDDGGDDGKGPEGRSL